jgi:DNA repair exonuclease SbcCD nuclease subunit
MMGNHDRYDANTNSFKLLSRLPKAGALTHVKFITKECRVKFCNLNVLVLPFGAKPKDVTDVDLIVFHDSVVGAKRHSGPNVILGQGIHPSKFKGILAVGGDIHLRQRIGKAFYPGTLAPMNFGEDGEKYFGYVDVAKLKYHDYEIDPPWNLKTIKWSNENPPNCDAENTYYRLIITDSRPPPRWMMDHPQVVKLDGGSKLKQQEVANKVVALLQGQNKNNETDSQLLSRWLKTFTPLDKLSRMQGIKIHESLFKSRST